MTPAEGLAFVERHGVVLLSARGPVPSLAEAVAGEPIRGSWWGHPSGQVIYSVATAVTDSPDVLACRLVDDKVTFIHRRLWPALVRLADRIPAARLARVSSEHTEKGHHRAQSVAYPDWVPGAVRAEAEPLSEDEAIALLGPAVLASATRAPVSRRGQRPPRQRPATPRRSRAAR
jgi:hypothetical protein